MSIRLTAQYAPRLRGIPVNLFHERVECREVLLVAQFRHKLNFNLPAVQVPGEVKHMHLEQRVYTADGGTGAEACRGTQGSRLDPVHADGKNPLQRCLLALHAQIRRWESQVPPEALSVDD